MTQSTNRTPNLAGITFADQKVALPISQRPVFRDGMLATGELGTQDLTAENGFNRKHSTPPRNHFGLLVEA